MFARLPGLRAKEVIAALENAGFAIDRQKGSHVTMRHPATKRTTVVPMHSAELPRWLMKKIVKDAGLTVDSSRYAAHLPTQLNIIAINLPADATAFELKLLD